MSDILKVTQADRECAWKFKPSCYGPHDRKRWMDGLYDANQAIVQIAAHRQASVNAYEPMLAALEDAFTILNDVEEINPSNYDHDLVCALNQATVEAFFVIKKALAKAKEQS